MQRIKNMSIGLRLNLIVMLMSALAIGVSILGHIASDKVAAHFATAYADRIVPIGQLSEVGGILSDNRSLLLELESLDGTAVQARVRQLESNADKATQLWNQYMEGILTPEEKALAERFVQARAAWLQNGINPSVEAMKRGDTESARRAVSQHSGQYQDANALLKELIQMQVALAKVEFDASTKTVDVMDRIMVAALLVGLVLAGVLSWLLARSITGPIQQMMHGMQRLERERDLTVRVPQATQDECGRMGAALNNVIGALEAAMQAVKQQAHDVSTSAIELAGASRTILESTASQSEAAASTASAVEELAVSVSHVAESADSAATLASHAADLSTQGEAVVQSAAKEMAFIAQDVSASSQLAQSLAKRSDDISGIVQVIKDVAEQTNLLALNAAIEAARAGEQGRGFAVVADEVRKLAERTARSAAEITVLIEHVQSDTRAVVHTMEGSIGRVDAGVEHARAAAQSLGEILGGTQTTQGKISEIASATKEQSTASNDIARHVERIAQMTEENSAAASQAASLASRLEDAAQALRSQVESFKTA